MTNYSSMDYDATPTECPGCHYLYSKAMLERHKTACEEYLKLKK